MRSAGLLIVLFGLICNATASAKTLSSSGKSEIAALIKNLDAPDYWDRENATRRLTELGIQAKSQLRKAAEHQNPEIRYRAARILKVVFERDYRARLDAFANDVDGSRNCSLPGWEVYRKYAGKGRLAREFFLEMHRAESALLIAYESDLTEAEEIFENSCRRLQVSFQQPSSIGTIAALLLVAGDPEFRASERSIAQLSTTLYQPTFASALSDSNIERPLKCLFSRWLEPNVLQPGDLIKLRVAKHYAFTMEAVALATDCLRPKSEKSPLTNDLLLAPIIEALKVMAQFGDSRHLNVVEPYLTDTSDLEGFGFEDVQLRDYALAVLVYLSEQDDEEYGLENAIRDGEFVLENSGSIFESSEHREEAFAKWHTWNKTQAEAKRQTVTPAG